MDNMGKLFPAARDKLSHFLLPIAIGIAKIAPWWLARRGLRKLVDQLKYRDLLMDRLRHQRFLLIPAS
jgi:hypothetical protein